MAEQDALTWVSVNLKRADDIRVFTYLLAVLDFENWIRISQAEIGRRLGMHRQNVNRAFRRLREFGVLERETVGSTPVYRISPHIAWKGRESTRQAALRDGWMERGFSVVDESTSERP